MKPFFFFFSIFLVKFSFAQKVDSTNYNGIFLNASDYASNKLYFFSNCDSASSKIKLNHFFSKNYIEIKKGDNKYRLLKDSIFGYRDCNHITYRFYNDNNHEYQIAENKNMVIYKVDLPQPTSSGKSMQLVTNYFFSVTLNSAILPLTVSNLKRAFPGNIKFHDMLDIEFNHASGISRFDDMHKMYLVNYILNQSNLN